MVEQQDKGLRHYPDLDEALADKGASAAEWRIHFHVPLFAREYDAFGSTQDYVRKVLAIALQTRFTTHLEIETYTWDVLPPGLKVDLGESIAREYEWVLQTIAGLTHASLSDTLPSDTRSTDRFSTDTPSADTRSTDTRSTDTRSSKK